MINSYNLEEIDTSAITGAMQSEKLQPVEKGDTVETSSDIDAKEHVYIVFKEGVVIDDGVAEIEKKVLSGVKLEVSRKDVTGNAVVAIVQSSQRKQIEALEIVERVKVNEAEDVKKNDISETESSLEKSEENEVKTEESDTQEAETKEAESKESDTQGTEIKASNTEESKSEENSVVQTVGEVSEEVGYETKEENSGSSVNKTGLTIGIIGGIIIVLCLVVGVLGKIKK